jgi:AsmA protein
MLRAGKPVVLELGFDLVSAQPAIAAHVAATAKVEADAQTKSARIDALTITVNLKGDSSPGGKVDAKLTADIGVDGSKQTATVRNLALTLLNLTINGSLDVTGLDKAPAIFGDLNLASFNPRELLEALGQAIPSTGSGVLTKLSLQTKLSASATALALKPLNVLSMTRP